MDNLRLYKKEKLCSVMAISSLIGRDAANFTTSAFPIRAFWRYDEARFSDAPIQFLVSIPKKRLRHAVDRVTMRRRIREAFRLMRHDYPLAPGVKIDIAFVYVDSKLNDYARVAKSMRRLLENIAKMTHEAKSLDVADKANEAKMTHEADQDAQ